MNEINWNFYLRILWSLCVNWALYYSIIFEFLKFIEFLEFFWKILFGRWNFYCIDNSLDILRLDIYLFFFWKVSRKFLLWLEKEITTGELNFHDINFECMKKYCKIRHKKYNRGLLYYSLSEVNKLSQ